MDRDRQNYYDSEQEQPVRSQRQHKPHGSTSQRRKPSGSSASRQRRPSGGTATRRRPESSGTRSRSAGNPQRKTGKKKPARQNISYGRMVDQRFGVRLLTALALVVAVILCCIVFFRVSTVSVVGNEKYTQEQIAEASGIAEGDALLLINKNAAAARIMAQLPYVDQVRIGTSFPNVVRLEVVELDTAYAVAATDGTYWLINSEGRVVEETTGKAASDYLTIEGFMVQPTAPGETVEASREDDRETDAEEETADAEETAAEETAPVDDSKPKDRMAVAMEIIRCLESYNGTTGITLIDVSSLYDIKVWYGTQYQVNMGANVDIPYKVEYMLAAIGQLNDYEAGVLDLTFQEEKVARFVPWTNE